MVSMLQFLTIRQLFQMKVLSYVAFSVCNANLVNQNWALKFVFFILVMAVIVNLIILPFLSFLPLSYLC